MKVQASKLRSIIQQIQADKKMRGTFFSISAVERGSGEIRKFISHFGYKKYLTGGASAYDFEEKNLLPVWDFKAWSKHKKGDSRSPIRTVNCNDIVSLKCCGINLIENSLPTGIVRYLN